MLESILITIGIVVLGILFLSLLALGVMAVFAVKLGAKIEKEFRKHEKYNKFKRKMGRKY